MFCVQGLANVIATVLPEAEHRNYARHIHANWSKTHRGLLMKNLFWKCAKSTSLPQLEASLAELDKADAEAGKDLRMYEMKLWCMAYFRTQVKCDNPDNNLSEAFNSTLVKCRSKPLIPMLEDIRVGMMKMIARKRKIVNKWKGQYGPAILKKLNKSIQASHGWHVDFNGDDGYEIKKGRHQYIVSLMTQTCSCRRCDLSGIPCAHAICAIFDKGEDPENYVHMCYSKEMYKKTYAYALQPINGELMWPRSEYEEIVAPLPKKMRGRPKKKRAREETELPTGATHIPRKGRKMKCSNCKQEGHNKKSCTNNTTATSGSQPSSSAVQGDGQNTDHQRREQRGRGQIQRGRPRRGRGKRGERGFGVYFDEHTGEIKPLLIPDNQVREWCVDDEAEPDNRS